MAASLNVPEISAPFKIEPLTPRHGVISLTGYGVIARVDRGHLVLRDAIGHEQREGRFPRIGHNIKRLVIVGCDGMISLAALRWLHDQRAAFVMLERNGNVLTAAGPSRPKDSRLRRAQALAMQDGRGLSISRYLIDRKLAAQAHIARETLTNESIAAEIASVRASLPQADTIDGLRWFEARAALAYWSAWHSLPIAFPKSAQPRVPAHWRRFGARRSSLTGSPRLAVNPPNAILN
ncbi:MAG: CRISPR-associated endonuclease Cas1, partial [bacterium]